MSYWTQIGDSDLYDHGRRHEVSVEEDVCGGYNPDPTGRVRMLVMPQRSDDCTYEVSLPPATALELGRRLIEAAHCADPTLIVPGAVVHAIEGTP